MNNVMRFLDVKAEKVKKDLGEKEKAKLKLKFPRESPMFDTKYTITRDSLFEHFEKQGLIGDIKKCVLELFDIYSFPKEEVTDVVLAGGSSALWFIPSLVGELLPNVKIDTDREVLNMISHGAAIIGRELTQDLASASVDATGTTESDDATESAHANHGLLPTDIGLCFPDGSHLSILDIGEAIPTSGVVTAPYQPSVNIVQGSPALRSCDVAKVLKAVKLPWTVEGESISYSIRVDGQHRYTYIVRDGAGNTIEKGTLEFGAGAMSPPQRRLFYGALLAMSEALNHWVADLAEADVDEGRRSKLVTHVQLALEGDELFYRQEFQAAWEKYASALLSWPEGPTQSQRRSQQISKAIAASVLHEAGEMEFSAVRSVVKKTLKKCYPAGSLRVSWIASSIIKNFNGEVPEIKQDIVADLLGIPVDELCSTSVNVRLAKAMGEMMEAARNGEGKCSNAAALMLFSLQVLEASSLSALC